MTTYIPRLRQQFDSLKALGANEVVRAALLHEALTETEAQRLAVLDIPDMTGMSTPQTLFIVRGQVAAVVYASITETIEVSGGTGEVQYGPELILDPDFEVPVGTSLWNYPTGWAQAHPGAVYDGTGIGTAQGYNAGTGILVMGAAYKIEFDITGTNSVRFAVGASGLKEVPASVGHYTGIVINQGDGYIAEFEGIVTGFLGTVNNVSVKQVLGGLGEELITNPQFTGDGAPWLAGTGWTLGDFTASFDWNVTPAGGPLTYPGSPIAGQVYQVVFDASGGGYLEVSVGGEGGPSAGNGQYSELIVAGSFFPEELLDFNPLEGHFAGLVTNVSVKEFGVPGVVPGGLSIGIEGNPERFASWDFSGQPLDAATIWVGNTTITVGDKFQFPSGQPPVVFLQDQDIKLFPTGEVIQGGMLAQVLWWPLQNGAGIFPVS